MIEGVTRHFNNQPYQASALELAAEGFANKLGLRPITNQNEEKQVRIVRGWYPALVPTRKGNSMVLVLEFVRHSALGNASEIDKRRAQLTGGSLDSASDHLLDKIRSSEGDRHTSLLIDPNFFRPPAIFNFAEGLRLAIFDPLKTEPTPTPEEQLEPASFDKETGISFRSAVPEMEIEYSTPIILEGDDVSYGSKKTNLLQFRSRFAFGMHQLASSKLLRILEVDSWRNSYPTVSSWNYDFSRNTDPRQVVNFIHGTIVELG